LPEPALTRRALMLLARCEIPRRLSRELRTNTPPPTSADAEEAIAAWPHNIPHERSCA
jgi:hypothetical protein